MHKLNSTILTQKQRCETESKEASSGVWSEP